MWQRPRTIYVDENHNHKLDKGEKRTTTDATGHWSLKLEEGTYEIRQAVPKGWANTTQRGVTVHADLDAPIEPIQFGTVVLPKKKRPI